MLKSIFYCYFPIALIICAGLGFSAIATAWVARWEHVERQNQFQQQIDNLTTALQRSINRYSDLLLAIGDLYAVADNQVSQEEFATFVKRSLRFYSGIQALEWAPYIPHAARANYETELQSRGYPYSLGMTERAASGKMIRAIARSAYVPVTYIEPFKGNEAALGFDLASDETRRVALERARNTGSLAATGRIKLVQETRKDQYGFLMFLPIYQPSIEAIAQRRQFLEGYVLGVFRIADVVEEALQDLNYNVDFYIFDQTAPPDQQFLGVYESAQQQVSTLANQDIQRRLGDGSLCPTGDDCTKTLSFGQREWRILFLPSPAYTDGYLPWGTVATFTVGVLLTAGVILYWVRSQTELKRTRELSTLKLRFFSMASHELRTPLSVILVTVQAIAANLETFSTEQKANALDRIQTSAKRMTQLLSDILTLTRAEAGKLEFVPEIVNLNALCWQIIDEVQTSIKSAEYPIVFTPLEGAQQAFLDPKLMRSILVNLLSNAIKYSPVDSKVELRLTCDMKHFYVCVVDQGIGIPLEAQSLIFEAFYRGNNVNDAPGTGLGLAVVKTCVDLHQGQLIVKSSVNAGTTITVVLPRVD
jgi:signal transduction histidine kinase